MKIEFKILLLGLLAVGLLDTIGSVASNHFNFNYTYLSPISLFIYGLISFLVTKRKNLKTGVVYAVILGLFDSTIGWKISMLLDADTGDYKNKISIGFLIFTIVFMIGLSALIGLIGGSISKIIKKKRITE